MSWPSRRRQERTSATMTTISMQCDRGIDAQSAPRARARKSSHGIDVYPSAPRLLRERHAWKRTTSRLHARFEVCIFPSGARRRVKLAKTRVVVTSVASGPRS